MEAEVNRADLAAWEVERRRAAHYERLRSALEHVRADIRPGRRFGIAEFACLTGWGHTKARQVLAEATVYGLVVRDSVSPARFFFLGKAGPRK
jgi:hypothetical protein